MRFQGSFVVLSLGAYLLVAQSVTKAEEMSIDEMIFSAAQTVDQFDQINDLYGNNVLVEMDMILTPEQYEARTKDQEEETKELQPMRKKRKAIKSTNYRWTNKIVPYTLDPRAGFTSAHRSEIMKAITEWQTYTCLTFRQRTNQQNYVNFQNGNGCYSYVGMTGGAQTIGLAPGCRYKGVVVHEIGHAVGFQHEQTRPDRDDYVQILFQNIPQSVAYNFNKYSWSTVEAHGVPYDYYSVMHYGGKAFSTNGQYTIRTRDPAYQNIIGNRGGLSFKDIKLANIMYNCASSCNKRCPSGAYLDKNCKCMCPGSPVKECDGTEVTSKPVTTSRPPVTTTPTTQCKDGNTNCPAWAKSSRNYCQTNSYVKNYCQKSCGFCSSTCKDQRQESHCVHWKEKNYCNEQFTNFMKENCAKTCGFCRPSGDQLTAEDGNHAHHFGSSFWTVVMATVSLVFSISFL